MSWERWPFWGLLVLLWSVLIVQAAQIPHDFAAQNRYAPQLPAAAIVYCANAGPNSCPTRRESAPRRHVLIQRQTQPACAWPGHCLGDPCTTLDDCDQQWVCGTGNVCVVTTSGSATVSKSSRTSVSSTAAATTTTTIPTSSSAKPTTVTPITSTGFATSSALPSASTQTSQSGSTPATTSSPDSQTDTTGKRSGIAVGAIVGIVLGVCCLLAALLLAFIFLRPRLQTQQKKKTHWDPVELDGREIIEKDAIECIELEAVDISDTKCGKHIDHEDDKIPLRNGQRNIYEMP